MKKVYQTIVDLGKGNCMQAAIAALFDEDLENVPEFIEIGREKGTWLPEFCEFLNERGYDYNGVLFRNAQLENYKLDEVKNLEGVNGYFYASVYSPKYNPNGDKGGVTHAVIVDKDLNIVFDPNPNYPEGIKYPTHEEGYNGIINIYVIEKIENKKEPKND